VGETDGVVAGFVVLGDEPPPFKTLESGGGRQGRERLGIDRFAEGDVLQDAAFVGIELSDPSIDQVDKASRWRQPTLETPRAVHGLQPSAPVAACTSSRRNSCRR
jgi:hypothetical protein